MKSFKIILVLFWIIGKSYASEIEYLNVYSNAMKIETKACVITPNQYSKSNELYPTLYLLHGYSGNYNSWVKDFKQTLEFSDKYGIIIVCVDGAFSSWYLDSPIDSTMKYETYVIKELVPFIDRKFKTIAKPEGRGISGLSMGGHGAFYLSMRHQNIFGVAGSMSGGVDIRPFPNNWNLPKLLGDINKYPENWEKNTVINQLHLIKNNNLTLIFDCGIDDFFIKVNRELHEKMLNLNIKHDYIERPGGHNSKYWSNALEYQVLFFHNFFKKNNI